MKNARPGISISHTFSALPEGTKDTGKPDKGDWKEGLVAGNGKTGVVCSCAPYSETYIFQNIDFLVPDGSPRHIPREVSEQLHEARQAVLAKDEGWDAGGRSRTYLYSFHPGVRLRLSLPEEKLLGYERSTDYGRGEITVSYADRKGIWRRRTFVSRADDIIFTEIMESDTGHKINLDISLDDPSHLPKFGKAKKGAGPEAAISFKRYLAADASFLCMAAHYPSYEESELKNSGYLSVTRILLRGGVAEGGTAGEKNSFPVVRVRNAETVCLMTRTYPVENMGTLKEFDSQECPSCMKEAMAAINEAALKYRDRKGYFSYDRAISPHLKLHGELFGRISLSLGEEDWKLDNEALLLKQKKAKGILHEMAVRAYEQGRYVQICCGGYSAPRLCGLWTGEWNPGWRGAYTMDANVNLQVSGMNTGSVYEAGLGYLYFILRQIPDWKKNAEAVYGMKNAVLAPVNTDGRRAVMVEYDKEYPFQYWNTGAAWMAVPVYEFWQCYGNRQIPVCGQLKDYYKKEVLDLEREILRPLLLMLLHFWEQLCTPRYYTDRNGIPCYDESRTALGQGEKYLIIPSYSPENRPAGYNSPITANASMDIAAARDVMHMIITLEEELKEADSGEITARCQRLLAGMPDYSYDHTKALCEWSVRGYKENNEHRHISHLYCAWPAHETQNNKALAAACRCALENRNRENSGRDDSASHGWVHKALVAARLKDGRQASDILRHLFQSDIIYSSLMTDHNTNRERQVYCTDTILGLVGIMNEMLVYSHTGVIELLPAPAPEWRRGQLRGLMTRTNACITCMDWDLEKGSMTVSIRSFKEQRINVSCTLFKYSEAGGEEGMASGTGGVFFGKEEEKLISFRC